MKYEIKEQQEKQFEPFAISIIIESREELLSLKQAIGDLPWSTESSALFQIIKNKLGEE